MSEVKHPTVFRNNVGPYYSLEATPETGEALNPKTAEIPLNHDGTPKISNAMKAKCIGEHKFTREVAGVDLEITVPWDLAKRIYKDMVEQAIQDAKEAFGP